MAPAAAPRAAVLRAVGIAASLLALSQAAEAAHRHRHHGQTAEPPPLAQPIPPPPAQNRAAYSSGYAFGLLDLGISGTPTALSPYAGYGLGYVGPGYDRPGLGVPAY